MTNCGAGTLGSFLGYFKILFREESPCCFGSLAVFLQLHPAAMFGSQLVLEPCKQEWGSASPKSPAPSLASAMPVQLPTSVGGDCTCLFEPYVARPLGDGSESTLDLNRSLGVAGGGAKSSRKGTGDVPMAWTAHAQEYVTGSRMPAGALEPSNTHHFPARPGGRPFLPDSPYALHLLHPQKSAAEGKGPG